jgi:hypothetical protein
MLWKRRRPRAQARVLEHAIPAGVIDNYAWAGTVQSL